MKLKERRHPVAYPKGDEIKVVKGQRERVRSRRSIAANSWMQAPLKSLGYLSSDINDAGSQLAGCMKVDLKYSVVEKESCIGEDLGSWSKI